jgi:hypothetical protein
MAKSSPDKTRRPPHPLATFRFITGLTREACGKVADLTAATIQNIELGKAPLYLENAELLEAYTDCSAMRLLEAVQQWKEGKLRTRAALVTVAGQPFTTESYEEYRSKPIPPESVEKAIKDLSTRIDLILGGLAGRSHEFRAAYRRMVQSTIKERRNSGVTDAELMARGQSHAKVESWKTTVAGLAKEETVAKNDVYKNEIAKRYKPGTKVDVSIEEFASWPFGGPNLDLFLLMDPNLQTGRTKLWRMNFPDGKQYVVRADSIENAQIGTTSLANAFWGEITQRGKMERNEWMAWTDLQSRLQRRKRSKK